MSPDPGARRFRFGASGWFREGPPAPRRPLLGMAAAFLIGIGLGLHTTTTVAVPFLLAGLFVAASFVMRGGFGATICLPLAVAALGWARADLRSPAGTRLSDAMERPAERLVVVGVIADEPTWHPAASGPDRDGAVGAWAFVLRAESVNRIGDLQPTRERMQVRWVTRPDALPPHYGDRWRFDGIVQDTSVDPNPRSAANRYTLRVTFGEAARLDVGAGNPFVAACLRGRHACARVIERGLDHAPRETGLLKALLLGYREELPPDLEETFAVTGTLHIFAISGLHVGVMGSILIAVLQTLGVPRHRWILFIAPLLTAYTVATGMKPSAVRACVMAVLFWSAPLFWRKPDAPSALAAAAILIVGVRPDQLVAPGFVLSFVVVSGILGLYPLIYEPIRTRFQQDPWMLPGAESTRSVKQTLALRLGSLAALSLACWLASAPLSASYFSILSPVALVGNILVVPAAFLIVLTGCLSMISGLVSVWVAETFNFANLVFTSVLLHAVDAMAALPVGHRYVRAPAVAGVLVWYGLLAVLVSGRRPHRWGGGALLLGLVVWWWTGPPRQGLVVDALDAEGAVTLHVNAGDRDHIIVNPGPAYRGPQLIRYLRGQGVNRIRAVMLTQSAPHVADAAVDLMDAFPVDHLWVGHGVRTDPAGIEAIVAATARGIAVADLPHDRRIALRDGTEWEVVWPPDPASPVSPCLRFANGMVSVLLCTSASLGEQAAFERAPVEWSASVLVLGTPRVPSALSPAWADAVGARFTVLSEKPVRLLRDEYEALYEDIRRAGMAIALTCDRGGVRIRGATAGDLTDAAVVATPVRGL